MVCNEEILFFFEKIEFTLYMFITVLSAFTFISFTFPTEVFKGSTFPSEKQ